MVSLELYIPVYYNVLLALVAVVFVQCSISSGKTAMLTTQNGGILTFFISILLLFYIGLRPISGAYFGDMIGYALNYEQLQVGIDNAVTQNANSNVIWRFFMMGSSKIIDVTGFFVLCAAFYILPIYFACARTYKRDAFFVLLMIITSFCFWSYGTNGMRCGIASSFFLLALHMRNRILAVITMALVVSVHSAMIIPVVGYYLTLFMNRNKIFLLIWVASIFMSIMWSDFFENIFSVLDTQNEKLNSYIYGNDVTINKGFRIDFLVYSLIPIILGCAYIYLHKFNDKFYNRIFNIYLFANSFWLLVIRTTYSNRFAYLSWFVMAFVIIYPLIMNKTMRYRYRYIGLAIAFNFAFTYFMNYVIGF